MTGREAIGTYLDRLEEALAALPDEDRADFVAEVRAHLDDAMRDAEDPDTAAIDAMASLGTPEAFAEKLRARSEERLPDGDHVKRILGVPYNFSPMSAEKVASRIWNPSDPRIVMPRVFGVGWTVNLGAVAVRLGLIRADDEEPLPFTHVPGAALDAGLATITVIDALWLATTVAYRGLQRLPVHWGLGGPDRFGSSTEAAAYFLVPALALLAVAMYRRLARGAGPTERTLTVSGLAFFNVMLLGFHADALVFAAAGREPYSSWVPVVVSLAVLFGTLVTYSRLGVRVEWQEARAK